MKHNENSQTEWEAKLFPECSKGYFKAEYQYLTTTLNVLGYKSTLDAIENGWIRVRKASYPRPGDFINKLQVPLLEKLARHIACFRSPELRTLEEKKHQAKLIKKFRCNEFTRKLPAKERQTIITKIETGLITDFGIGWIFQENERRLKAKTLLGDVFLVDITKKRALALAKYLQVHGDLLNNFLEEHADNIKKLSSERRARLVEHNTTHESFIKKFHSLVYEQSIEDSFTDLQKRRPELFRFVDFFQTARKQKRKIKAFLGPTNSGKTFQAIKQLANAKTGVYLAPLRLLALELYDELTALGLKVSLITGEERILSDSMTHVSSTVEMLDLSKEVEVIVVDEVQMLASNERGWAWTQAILGAPCKELYLCGSVDALPILRALASYLGEPLDIIYTKRESKLEYLSTPISVKNIPKNSAVVGFSRNDVLDLKEQFEKRGHFVSVVYGSLSPSVRRQEAQNFREGKSQILVATDAIAMGLNLPIEYLFFYRLQKFDGVSFRRLHVHEVQQIAGRAGRRGIFEKGYVGLLQMNQTEGRFLESSLRQKKLEPFVTKVFIAPTFSHVEAISRTLGSFELAKIFVYFKNYLKFDQDWLQPHVSPGQLFLAARCDRTQLDLLNRYIFSLSPVDIKSEGLVAIFDSFLRDYSQQKPIKPPIPKNLDSPTILDRVQLESAELCVKQLTLYRWFSFRFPEIFFEQRLVSEAIEALDRKIIKALRERKTKSVCKTCSRPLPSLWQYPNCDDCYKTALGRDLQKAPVARLEWR